MHDSWRWWSLDELAATTEVVLPVDLAGVVQRAVDGDPAPEPVELPWTAL
ncbi:MAG: hypothetical protein AVDCRST_MAG50-1075 [uncultured Acidimicrobiales bacterium]|uniref:Nudix hydrolase domain-containing protein n=1 Tax=uncultured Acidimicrobiales bacterium TaxID=310071 RepID=A0A6J4HRP1_9ACTN|nr:MAG: hypothetical protein AVDCRST_MAG50-1075 [uncultured Acidimicrobiales bacterium]